MKSSFAFVPTNVTILLNATKNNLEQFIRGGEEHGYEGKDDDASRWSRKLDFDWHFLKLSVFHISRREEGGIMHFEAESRKERLDIRLVYFLANRRQCALLCGGDADIDVLQNFVDSVALHSTADQFLDNMEGNGAMITQLTEAELRR